MTIAVTKDPVEIDLPQEWHDLIRTAKGPRHKNWRLASELEGKIRRELAEKCP